MQIPPYWSEITWQFMKVFTKVFFLFLMAPAGTIGLLLFLLGLYSQAADPETLVRWVKAAGPWILGLCGFGSGLITSVLLVSPVRQRLDEIEEERKPKLRIEFKEDTKPWVDDRRTLDGTFYGRICVHNDSDHAIKDVVAEIEDYFPNHDQLKCLPLEFMHKSENTIPAHDRKFIDVAYTSDSYGFSLGEDSKTYTSLNFAHTVKHLGRDVAPLHTYYLKIKVTAAGVVKTERAMFTVGIIDQTFYMSPYKKDKFPEGI